MKKTILYSLFSLLAGISLACNDSGATVVINTVSDVYITTSLPGGTEGKPDLLYIFTAHHSTTTLPIEYEWHFDDATDAVTVRGSAETKHVFAREGWFNVTLNLVNYEKHITEATASFVVNIRNSTPIIETEIIPPGSFVMGSVMDNSEQPIHTVQLSRSLLVAKYELTQAQWETIMGISPSWFQGENLPVENLTWYQAIDFCNRLSLREGLVPCYTIKGDTVQCFFSSTGYRLPTEAEWEYFARAGATKEFYGGTVEQPFAGCSDSDTLDSDLDKIAWYCMNADSRTHPVGQKTPNAFGLYDVIGNVGEWCWDIHNSSYYSTSPIKDPTGATSGENRVVRGGNFSVGAYDARLSNRRLNTIAKHAQYITGFRLVRTKP